MKLAKLFLCLLMCCTMFYITAFANEDTEWDLAEKNASADVSSELLPEGVNRSRGLGNYGRGRYIGSSAVSITNEGYGKIGVYADTLAHVDVKKIQMNIYLDRWNEEKQRWVEVKMYKYVYTPSGDETLHAVSEAFTVTDQPAGYYYRLRGLHGVWAYTGEVETHSSVTDGIMIKNGPA